MADSVAESVADYPRPPVVVPCERRVRVEFAGRTVADSTAALRVLETHSPPTIYVPRADVRTEWLEPVEGRHTVCEFKGRASYSVRAQAGSFYGGWITADVRGPFKGDPGTEHW